MSVPKLKSTTIKDAKTIEPSYYFVIFDDYLQPKNQQTFNKHGNELLTFSGAQCKEVAPNRNIGEKWRLMFNKFTQHRIVKVKPLNNQNETSARKPKSSFQIYCEIASLHGLIYLVSTSRWQRLFWYFILCLMLYLSIVTLWNSLSLNADNPTILYVGSKTGIMWGRSFPTITLCNLNRISKNKLNDLLLSDFSPEIANQIRPFIPYLLYGSLPVNATPASYRYLHTILSSKNYTHKEFLQKISPDCESQLLRCKIHGQIQPCNALFRRVETQNGFCCAFNFDDVINGNQTAEELNIHTNRFGYKWGLTVLLDPQVEDYYASRNKFAGYQIYARSATDFININQPNEIVFPRREIYVHITPLITEVAAAVKWHDLHLRRCYLPKERKLFAFDDYSQQNCFAECRSLKMLKICGCVPPLWPRAHNWTVCTLMQASCVMAQIDTVMRTIHPSGKDYKLNQKAERYICKCYPKCESLIYKTDYGNTILDRNYSISDLEFYRGIELKNHLVVHAFYAEMCTDYMRLDVRYQLINYFGLIGGITSLYMGYSFISGFEIVFFLIVLPLGNLLTRITVQKTTITLQDTMANERHFWIAVVIISIITSIVFVIVSEILKLGEKLKEVIKINRNFLAAEMFVTTILLMLRAFIIVLKLD